MCKVNDKAVPSAEGEKRQTLHAPGWHIVPVGYDKRGYRSSREEKKYVRDKREIIRRVKSLVSYTERIKKFTAMQRFGDIQREKRQPYAVIIRHSAEYEEKCEPYHRKRDPADL